MTNQAYTLGLKKVGQDVTIWSGAKIISSEVISIGDSVIIDDFVFLMGGQSTKIGSFIHIGAFTSIAGGGEFIMEDFTGLVDRTNLKMECPYIRNVETPVGLSTSTSRRVVKSVSASS
ncbi:hypothetical protein RZS08_08545 [Arthrospira platensis SPKY1]|nr:hypothetical protein [Arthrospira platensis SPKY1]